MQKGVKEYFKNKKVLIIGGTGSWGKELVRQMVHYYKPAEIRVFSRNEHSQLFMRQRLGGIKGLHYIIGDVRDFERVNQAMNNIDVVFNLAALKHVPVCEENVWEAVQTNIHGCHNVITAAIHHGIKAMVQISSDKASDPLNLYGFTKGCAEKLTTSANNSPARKAETKFVCVRGGNVLGTTGSVIPVFKEQIKKYNQITLTDERMSRFFMRVEEAINLVLKAVVESQGGEIYVMKMPGVKIIDLAQVVVEQLGNKKTKIKKIGIRPGEKMYEVLVSKHESPRTVQDGEYYIILPDSYHKYFNFKVYKKCKPIQMEEYNSLNTNILNKKQILDLLERDGWLEAN